MISPMETDSNREQVRALLLISNLEYGGAQRQVVALANNLSSAGVEAHVCTLSDYTPLSADLIAGGDHQHVIQKHGKFDWTVVPRLRKLIEHLNIQVVHAFLLDAEIAARLAGRSLEHVAVVGSERNSDHRFKWHQATALNLTRRWCDAIIANSEAGRRLQLSILRVPEDRVFVVRNGVDTGTFSPRPPGPIRSRLGIDEASPVVGMFCSFKRQKNHAMFFRVARRLLDVDPQFRFLCVGAELHGGLQGTDRYRTEMLDLASSLGLAEAIIYLGNRDDVADLYNACDVTVLTSMREGTPNVVLESMACGVPVVVTDVADNAIIVPEGQVGYVVPYDDDELMAQRTAHLMSDPAVRESQSVRARRWVESEFSNHLLASRTADVYRRAQASKADRTRS